MAAKAEQKARTCPYCGSKIVVNKSKHLTAAGNAREASIILKRLKRKAAEKRKS